MRRVISGGLGLLLLLALLVGVGGVGAAQTATNVQDGENSSRSNQAGNSSVGQSITGQVVGVSSGGPSSVNATNSTDNSTAQTGDASAGNHANTFAGQRVAGETNTSPPGPKSVAVSNAQTGDNRNTISQSASASTGDGIAGQIIGVSTSGGPSSIVASNTTTNSDVFTGDATTDNSANGFAGQSIDDIRSADLALGCFLGDGFCPATANATLTATNAQTGDNRARTRQSSNASTGDGIAGQVIGASTSGGSSSIVASNTSRDVGVFTGDADSENHADAFAGEEISGLAVTAGAAGCLVGCLTFDTATAALQAANHQTGDNTASTGQAAHASTGDGIAGQVIGAATSGGSSVIQARNESTDADVATGNADADNSATALAGLEIADVSATALAVGCLTDCGFSDTATASVGATNTQLGDNTARPRQSAGASTGDGVAGQVIGASTSGGSSTIAASNTSRRVDVTTGDADADNSATAFAGLDIHAASSTAIAAGCLGGCGGFGAATATVVAANAQTGDNTARASQAANASTGDGVAGQDIGAVTRGGGTRVDASNRTEDSNVDTGDASASNSSHTSAGLNISGLNATATAFGCLGLCIPIPLFASTSTTATNNQTGNNSRSASQAANASSGDAIGGQLIGVSSTGGPTVVTISNTTTGTNTQSGSSHEDNSDNAFVGLAIAGSLVL